MVIIQFKDGTDWFEANWIFRQFSEDVVAAFPNDASLELLLGKAQALGALFLDDADEDVSIRTVQAMRRVAEDTLRGSIQGWKRTRPDDKDGQQMYLEAIEELLALLRKNDWQS